jgi:hypothetical protein
LIQQQVALAFIEVHQQALDQPCGRRPPRGSVRNTKPRGQALFAFR